MALLAGVGKREITPAVGTPMGGNPTSPPSRGVNDPLWTKVLFLESGEDRVVLGATDLVSLPTELTNEVRQTISRRLQVPKEGVVLCATHTHAGPSLAGWDGHEAYLETIKRGIFEAAEEARSNAAAASVSYAFAKRDDLSQNRRFVMQDGSVVTNARMQDGILRRDGPIDPEIQIVLVTDGTDRPVAVMVGVACHPTSMGQADGLFSADYPFWIEQEVKAAYGEQVEVLFFAGALGDVRDGGIEQKSIRQGIDHASHIGRTIGKEVVRALRGDKTSIGNGLKAVSVNAALPTIDMGVERQQWAKDVLDTPEGRPTWQVRDARMVLGRCDTWPAHIDAEIPVVSVGDLAFYGIPGELFCWYGLQLKARSRFRFPFVLGLANQRIGYIADRVFPTKDIFNVELDFEHRQFGETHDAGETLVTAALGV